MPVNRKSHEEIARVERSDITDKNLKVVVLKVSPICRVRLPSKSGSETQQLM